MYNVSQDYKNAMNAYSRKSYISGTLELSDGTLVHLSDSDIMENSFKINNACVNGSEFELGAVYLGELKISINTEINRYKLYGGTLNLSFNLEISDGVYEPVPFGEYTIEDADRVGKYISITAYDRMSNFNKTCNITTAGTPFNLLKTSCDFCGMQLEQTQAQIDAMSAKDSDNNVIELKIKNAANFETFRDLISEVATSIGCFATISRDGKLRLRRFAADEFTINERHRKETEVSDYKVRYSGMKVKIGDDTFTRGDASYQVLTIENNLWNVGVLATKNAIVDNVWNVVRNILYVPVNIDLDGDPSFDLGDKIIISGGNLEESVSSLIMKYDWSYRGTENIQAVGSNPLLASAKSKTEKDIDGVHNDIEENKLRIISFQSSTPYSIDNYNTLICSMDISGSGTIIFNGQILLNVTNPGTFEIVYELNGQIVSMYQPKQVATFNGNWMINMFYPITNISEDLENVWSVYLKSSDGGTGEIAAAGVVCSLMGVAGGGERSFNEHLEFTETMAVYEYSGIDMLPLEDEVSTVIS